MNAIILNGGGGAAPYGDIAARAAAWARRNGYDPAVFDLPALSAKPCLGCFTCWTVTPGRCVHRDGMEEVVRRLAVSDLTVLVTPVSFGGYGYHLKKTMDRSIPILLPFFIRVHGELHHPLRYEYGERRLAAIGVLPAPDAESERIFHTIIRRNAINMSARPASVAFPAGETGTRWEDRLDAAFAAPGEN